MTFYSGLATTATRLLTEKGQQATWSRTTGGTFNPATGATTGGTTTNYSAYGVLLDFDTRLIDGDNILRTDKRFVMQSGDVPEVNDVVTVNSVAYTVLAIRETNPAGTAVIYELQLRS